MDTRIRGRILLVDDDPALRLAVGDRLRHWGLVVTDAATGDEALDLARRQDFELIILDLAMPGRSRLEVLDSLRRDECTADVVVLTALGSVDRAVDAIKRGAEDFLTLLLGHS